MRWFGGVLLAACALPLMADEPFTELPAVEVRAPEHHALDPNLAMLGRQQAEIPGAGNLVLPREGGRLASLSDALGGQPGIILQAFAGGHDQPRLNVRGSGIQSNPVSRGVLLREDGLPLNAADGSFIIGLLEPRNSWAIVAARGANSRALGPPGLGGDINFLSASGRDDRLRLRLEQGGYGRRGLEAVLGGERGRSDWRVFASADDYAGFRHHSNAARRSLRLGGGWQAGAWSSRWSLSATQLDFRLPFALDPVRARQRPREVIGDADPFWPGPQPDIAGLIAASSSAASPRAALLETLLNVYRRDPRRDTRQLRLASRQHWRWAGWQFGMDGWGQDTRDLLVDPLSLADSQQHTAGLQLYARRTWRQGYLQLGGQAARSRIDRAYFDNAGGQPGQQYADLWLRAAHQLLDLQFGWRPLRMLELTGQWQYGRIERQARHDDEHLRQGWMLSTPKLGLILRPAKHWRAFLNYSASAEAPSFWELAANKVDPLPLNPSQVVLTPLRLQRARSLELGGEGWLGAALRWQATLYRSRLHDELLSTAGSSGIIDATENYPGITRHQGVELGLSGAPSLAATSLVWRLAWTFSDFHFDDGPYAGRRMAGVPRHQVQARALLQWGGWSVGPALTWSPARNPVDHENTLFQEAYRRWDWQVEYRARGPWRAFALIENLGDTRYNSAYVVRSRAESDLPSFFPGNGRSVNLGMLLRF